MVNIKKEIEAEVSDIFKKQAPLYCQGKEVTLVKVLGIEMQTRLNNCETEEFLITFRGQIADENGGIIEDCYSCTVNMKVNVCINVEPINVISVKKI